MRKVNSGIFEQLLKVKLNSIERIQRLGKKINRRNRPVILRFADFREKKKVLMEFFKV